MKKKALINVKRLSAALVASCGILLLFMSCAKDKDNDLKSKRDLLVGKKWKVTALTLNPGMDDGSGHLITDLYSWLPACVKDDYIGFNANGTGTSCEGATRCNNDDPASEQFSWSMNSDGTNFQTNLEGRGAVKLLSLTASAFTLEIRGAFEDAGEQTATITYNSF